MPNHITQSQIQTLLAVTPVSALTYGQMMQLVEACDRLSFTRVIDSQAGLTGDPSLATIFPSAGNNP